MELSYCNSLSPEELNGLREAVGWARISERQAKIGLEHTEFLVAARDGDRTVACARIVGDGGYVAYLCDVIVHPDYQGHGVGKAMIGRLLEYIRSNLEPGERVKVFLMAAKGRESFYRQFGFLDLPDESEGAGMVRWMQK
jgi:GNAT superfamily N-acetyltransferase